MEIDSSRIQELIERPGESLSVELKRWIDPDSPDGIAKWISQSLRLPFGLLLNFILKRSFVVEISFVSLKL